MCDCRGDKEKFSLDFASKSFFGGSLDPFIIKISIQLNKIL